MIESLRAANRFMRLAQSERWLILETSFYLICAKVATLATPTRTLLALGTLDASYGTMPIRADALPAEILPAIEALDASSRFFRFANCLTRAVALRMLLAHRDIATEMHIGARKDENGQFAAHAWLTYEGTILLGGEEDLHLYRELVTSTHDLLQ